MGQCPYSSHCEAWRLPRKRAACAEQWGSAHCPHWLGSSRSSPSQFSSTLRRRVCSVTLFLSLRRHKAKNRGRGGNETQGEKDRRQRPGSSQTAPTQLPDSSPTAPGQLQTTPRQTLVNKVKNRFACVVADEKTMSLMSPCDILRCRLQRR